MPPDLYYEIERRFEEVDKAKEEESKHTEENDVTSQSVEARNIHRLAIFDAFNEALDLERPYNFKGLPNPWSKQTRVTCE